MKSAFKITGYYALFASLWIILSDRLISTLFKDAATLTLMASAKGLLFVTVTSLMLYFMIKRELAVKNKVIVQLDREVVIREQLIRELHHRIKNNIQVAIGLLNIETMDGDFSQDVKERISNKLISMVSVFNIVYDLRDMKNVSFRSVLAEYQRISFRNIDIDEIDPRITYSIEVIVTCLLLIDSSIEVYLGGDDSIRAKIASAEEGSIDISFQARGRGLNEPDKKDLAFLELQAKAIDGDIGCDSESEMIRIRFRRFKE